MSKRISILVIALSVFLSSSCLAVTADPVAAKTVTYTPDYETIFPNPERGLCKYVDILSPEFFPGSSLLMAYRPYMTQGSAGAVTSRIMHSYIRLDNYADSPQLPQSFLDDLDKGLAEVRRAGMKIILRGGAYSMSMDWLVDVPLDTIMSHMRQINKVIAANADVVLAIEAGFFGPWGEWHDNRYSTYEDRLGAPNPEGESARATLVKGILETTPDNIKVVIRYPDYLEELLENNIFTQSEKNRLGMHNDGIAQSDHNGGTYIPPNIQAGKKNVYELTTSDGFNRYYGGETDPNLATEGYLDGYKVLDDSYNTNMTEYNGSWSIPEIWYTTNLPASGNDPAETTYQRLLRKTGYRLRLVNATFSNFANPSEVFDFSAVIDNDGYAGPINSRPVYLVFDNGNIRRNVQLNGVEVRSWLGGDNYAGPYNIEAKDIQVPADLAPGNYTLALWLPDSTKSLQSRPEYSIRLANKYMWDAQKGYNKLGTVTIGATVTGMSSWAEEGITSAVAYGIATPDLLNKYTSTTTRAEFCKAAVHLLEQYYNMPAEGIIYKQDLLTFPPQQGCAFLDTSHVSANLDERIEGSRSLVGRSDGSSDWYPILSTNTEELAFTGGKTYEVRFKYKILEAPDKHFYSTFSSIKADVDKQWIPGVSITGKSGETGEFTMTRTLGPYDDYIFYVSIEGRGALSIDGIIITEKGATTPLAKFDFEAPALQKEPSTGTYPLSAKELTDIEQHLGLQGLNADEIAKARSKLTVLPSFSDTSDPVIRAAAALGITSGTGNSTFSPDAPLTREQAATMLANVLKIIGVNTAPPNGVAWTDANSISSWAKTSVDMVYDYKIMKGTGSTSLVFSPSTAFTHEQSLLTLNNLWKYLDEK
ncbi:MAG: DUF4832 domain-containing protein [Clostridiaceae bacterium]|nr:DUF4832 domain-containing protein [Clostridiaceae bacterium]